MVNSARLGLIGERKRRSYPFYVIFVKSDIESRFADRFTKFHRGVYLLALIRRRIGWAFEPS